MRDGMRLSYTNCVWGGCIFEGISEKYAHLSLEEHLTSLPKGILLGDYDKAIPDSHAKVMQNEILQSDYRGEAHSFPTIKGKQAQDIGMIK